MDAFEKKIKGFSDGDTVLSGIEARTSSPLRMERDESFQGIKTAEQLIENMDKKYNIL